jgi:3-hydroxybutyrate dehydrogenase
MGMLSGKAVLVTGAGSGIGLAMARAFAREGARVLVHDVRDARWLAEELGGVFLQADLADPQAVEALGKEAAALGVDILVNNAGFQHIDPVEAFPLETWQAMVQVMLTAPFQLIKALIPGMKAKGWGRIINVASVHGLVASPCKSAYISAKHGLVGLTRTVALEAGPHGITVNAIAPAYVRTPLVEGQIQDQARTLGISLEEVVEKVFLAQAAIRRLIEPEEVAELALFLASDKASAITGAVLPIDLGWTAR